MSWYLSKLVKCKSASGLGCGVTGTSPARHHTSRPPIIIEYILRLILRNVALTNKKKNIRRYRDFYIYVMLYALAL